MGNLKVAYQFMIGFEGMIIKERIQDLKSVIGEKV